MSRLLKPFAQVLSCGPPQPLALHSIRAQDLEDIVLMPLEPEFMVLPQLATVRKTLSIETALKSAPCMILYILVPMTVHSMIELLILPLLIKRLIAIPRAATILS